MSSKAPLTFIHWICTIPAGKKNSIETLCSSACQNAGFNRVVVRYVKDSSTAKSCPFSVAPSFKIVDVNVKLMDRHSPHATTKLPDGSVVQDDLHITADFVHSMCIIPISFGSKEHRPSLIFSRPDWYRQGSPYLR